MCRYLNGNKIQINLFSCCKYESLLILILSILLNNSNTFLFISYFIGMTIKPNFVNIFNRKFADGQSIKDCLKYLNWKLNKGLREKMRLLSIPHHYFKEVCFYNLKEYSDISVCTSWCPIQTNSCVFICGRLLKDPQMLRTRYLLKNRSAKRVV